jgi:dCTP deaminase
LAERHAEPIHDTRCHTSADARTDALTSLLQGEWKMSVLSDREIDKLARSGLITPYDQAQLQPASIDVRLGTTLLVPDIDPVRRYIIVPGLTDARSSQYFIQRPLVTALGASMPYTLPPGGFVLASTLEFLRIPDWLTCTLMGKSSIGRWGLSIHVTAGFVDPGFEGTLTLELANVGPFNIVLTVGMDIAQLAFSAMAKRANKPYSGRYQGQKDVTPSIGGGGGTGGTTNIANYT